MVIWAIPGFLGLPTDWDILQWPHLRGVDLHAFSWNSLTEWGTQFNAWVERKEKEPAILMGYSLGGRLALHALLQRPQQWQAAIIVSAHPGITHLPDRKRRQKHDQEWANRFETEEWSSLMQAWNGQQVFQHETFHFQRQEKDYPRGQLAQCLKAGSLGQQTDLRSHIASLAVPLLWITGSEDCLYSQIAQMLCLAHPSSRWENVQKAGHRVPWSQTQIFSDLVQAFLKDIKGCL